MWRSFPSQIRLNIKASMKNSSWSAQPPWKSPKDEKYIQLGIIIRGTKTMKNYLSNKAKERRKKVPSIYNLSLIPRIVGS